MWVEWGTRLTAILALLTIIAGLVILALPEKMEGKEMVRLDAAHSLRVADVIGAGLVSLGTILSWAAVLTWQRERIEP